MNCFVCNNTIIGITHFILLFGCRVLFNNIIISIHYNQQETSYSLDPSIIYFNLVFLYLSAYTNHSFLNSRKCDKLGLTILLLWYQKQLFYSEINTYYAKQRFNPEDKSQDAYTIWNSQHLFLSQWTVFNNYNISMKF